MDQYLSDLRNCTSPFLIFPSLAIFLLKQCNAFQISLQHYRKLHRNEDTERRRVKNAADPIHALIIDRIELPPRRIDYNISNGEQERGSSPAM